MRRLIWTALCLMLCLLCVTAQAAPSNLEEWNLYCIDSMRDTSPVYEVTIQEIVDGTYDESMTDLTYVFTQIGSVNAARSIRLTGDKADGKVEIAYWDGGLCYGYVNEGTYQRSAYSVKVGDDTYYFPHRTDGNDALLRRSIALRYPSADADLIVAAANGKSTATGEGSGGGSGGTSSSKKKTSAKAAEPAEDLNFYLTTAEGAKQAVTLETLGMVRSIIRLDGETITVDTADLSWATTTDEAHRMAIINAPRTGQATMHAKKNGKGGVLKKCKTNRIVPVLEYGSKYSRILYNGAAGYVLTSALEFYPVGGVKDGDHTPQAAQVSYKGNVNSRQSINIRMNGKNGSRILTEFRAGTAAWVFSQDDKWSEIEIGGYRGYILNEYLTMDSAE